MTIYLRNASPLALASINRAVRNDSSDLKLAKKKMVKLKMLSYQILHQQIEGISEFWNVVTSIILQLADGLVHPNMSTGHSKETQSVSCDFRRC